MNDQEMQQNTMTKEEVQRFLADRKEAGKKIDIETCEFMWEFGYPGDPYEVYSLPPEAQLIGRIYFVRSAEGGGWVDVRDLPPATFVAFEKAFPRLMKHWQDLPWWDD